MTKINLNPRLLSGNALKIIAAVLMLIDHTGYIIFPQYKIFRIIGRMSFPIFAFMIAEGCHYTKNRLRYFLGIFSLGIICQIVYYVFDGSLDMGILITFSQSILLIYALDNLKEYILSSVGLWYKQLGAILLFIFLVAAVYLLCSYVSIDYGFWGCMTPVFASVFRRTRKSYSALTGGLDFLTIHVFMMGISLVILSVVLGGVQAYSLLSLPIIMSYSGRRGTMKMKNFFYVFYPAHLVVLQAIAMMIRH